MLLLLAFQTAGLHCSGEDWRAIIGQWTRMPDSTEQIIVQRLNSKASNYSFITVHFVGQGHVLDPNSI